MFLPRLFMPACQILNPNLLWSALSTGPYILILQWSTLNYGIKDLGTAVDVDSWRYLVYLKYWTLHLGP